MEINEIWVKQTLTGRIQDSMYKNTGGEMQREYQQ